MCSSFTIARNESVGVQVKRSDLVNAEEYEVTLICVRYEIEEKYGAIRNIAIPKPVCHPLVLTIIMLNNNH